MLKQGRRLFEEIPQVEEGDIRHYTRLHGLFKGMVCDKKSAYSPDSVAE